MTTPPFPTGTVISGNQKVILNPFFLVTRILTPPEALPFLLSCYMGGWGGAGWGNNVHVYFANIG